MSVGEWLTGGYGDGLGQFGVDRVATSASICYLYASNDASQTVSVFALNRMTGALTPLPQFTVTPVPRSQARYDDIALTVTPDGRFLIVGMGSSFIANRVISYRINADGSLTEQSNLVSPTISLPLRLSQLAVNPYSNLLAVSYTSVAGYVALYGINSTGGLTEEDLLPDMAAYGRAQGLAWSLDGSNIYAALVNNRPASVVGIGIEVSENTTLGLQWTMQSLASDDSNLVAVDPLTTQRLFYSTQMPAVVVAAPPVAPPDVSVLLGTDTGFTPSLINVPFGTTVQWEATVSGVRVLQGTGDISCAAKLNGFDSNVLAAGETFRYTFDSPGSFFVIDPARCLSDNVRMLVFVGDPSLVSNTGASVNPIRARATTLEFTQDGEHLLTGLQVGGFAIQRVAANSSLTEVAFTSGVVTNGLQGSSALQQSPLCCKDDLSGPVIEWDPVVNVPCTYRIKGPVMTLAAGCDWLADQLVVEGLQIPTCNSEADALFRVNITDLCGMTTVATQYIKHDPDRSAPLVSGGTVQTVECVAGEAFRANPDKVVVVDQCQPRWALNITQLLGPLTYYSAAECRQNKVIASCPITWYVSDPCGNVAVTSGSISSVDTLAPVINITDWVVPCALQDQCVTVYNGGVSPDWSGYATATDQCFGPLPTAYFDVVPDDAVPGCTSFERHWRATDNCGNAAEKVQTISFEAAQEPQFVVPPNITVECGLDLGLDRTGYPTITAPPCVDLTKRVDTFRDPQSPRCSRLTLRKFSAQKTTCGAWNATSTQWITEVDTQGPQIRAPSPIHITCEDGQDVSPNNPAVGWPTVMDACQGHLVPQNTLRYSDVIRHLVRRPPHCLDEITRTWIAADECGNISNATQTIFATRECVPCGSSNPDCKITN